MEIGLEARSYFHRTLTAWATFAIVGSMLLRMAWRPVLGLPEDAFIPMAAGIWALGMIAPPWLLYRRFRVEPWKMRSGLVVLAVMGIAMGLAVTTLETGEGWERWPIGDVPKTFAVAVVLGVTVAASALAVLRARLWEARQRSARLVAEAEHERLERQAVQAELKLLQAQVEPHFLFNTLANVRHLVQSGSPDSLPMLDHLITYLRTALPDIRSESSTLGREAELARAYLEIMKMRMGGELAFTIDVAPELAAHAFPPFMLMTLVENAVKHGIVPKGGGNVRIAATRSGDRIVVRVIDDGRGLGGALGQGFGLANVRERLKALYGESARLVLESGESGGTVARLEISA